MTLALYGKSRRRKGLLIMLALLAVFAATLGGVSYRNSEQAFASNTAVLVPIADGGDSAWDDVPDGADDYLTVTEGACAADTSFITTGTDNRRSSFDIDESSIPDGATITRVDVTFCYSDADTTNSDEVIRPYAKTGGNNANGANVTFGGSTTPTLAATQQIDVADFVKDGSSDIEIGVQSRGDDAVRVYAIWAVVQYNAPPTEREIVVQKVSSAASHAGGTFDFSVAHTGAGSPNAVSVNLAANALNSPNSSPVVVPVNGVVTVTETSMPVGWTNTRWKVVNNNSGNATCGTSGFSGAVDTSADVPADANNYLVCFRNTPPASNTTLCENGDVNACIALLDPHNGPQSNPANSCQGIDANFVIDVSGSIGSSNMASVRTGIQSFANALAGSSVFSGTKFSSSATAITSGYVDAASFNTAVGTLVSDGATWTEGGINVGRNNILNATANPDMMFIVTDGSPNRTAANDTTGGILDWIDAANQAIAEANAARSQGFIVRAVFAGTGDPGIPFDNQTDRNTFAAAVLTRLGGGSFLSGDWDTIASNLLQSAGCDPTVNKSAGAAGAADPVTGLVSTVTWTVTLTNPGSSVKNVTVTDTGATLTNVVGASACTPDSTPASTGPWNCAIPAKSGVSGQVTMTLTTAVPAYNVCTGTSGSNTVTVTGGATGSSTATYTIPANPNHPSCKGSIVVHKVEEGGFDTAPNTWNFALSGGPTVKSPQSIADEGTTIFSGLDAGTYTVTETNTAVAQCSTTSPAGSFQTAVSLSQDGPWTPASSIGNLVLDTIGESINVWFKNTPCPGTIAIAKSSNPETTVPAGGSATWTVTVTVGVNPTTAPVNVTDTLRAGMTIAGAGVSAPSFTNCPANAGGTSIGAVAATGCTLPAGMAPGTYTITIPVQAPANFPMANCKEYENTATLSGNAGGTLLGSASASDSLTVTGCVDPGLTLSKSDDLGSNPLAPGGPFTWTVTVGVTNGPTVAAATIIDTLPAGFTFNGAITTSSPSLTCAAPVSSSVTCTLAAGSNGAFSISIPVKAPTITSPTQCGPNVLYTNNVTGTFPAGQGNNAEPASDTVAITCPSISITKTAVASPVNIGEAIGFKVTVTNSGTVPATGISVSDQLPTAASGLTWSATVTETPSNAGSCSVNGSGLLTCSGIDLAPGASIDLGVTATTTAIGATRADICTTFTNTGAQATLLGVTVTQVGSASVTVNCPSLTVVKEPLAGSVNAGQPVGFIIGIWNNGAVAAAPVSFSDTMPVATGVVWGAPTTTSSTGSCSISGAPQVVSCTGLTIPAGGSITVTVSGTTTGSGVNLTCGPITNNQAVATYLGSPATSGSASITVNCPDPKVEKSSASPISAGDQLSYTITVTPGGTGSQAVILTDTVPLAGTTWTIGGSGAANCSPSGTIAGGSQLNCKFNPLDAVKTVTLTATSTPAMCSPNGIINTATITPAQGSADVNTVNNSDDATIIVNCPNVTLTKVASPDGPINAGDDLQFTITATNSGPGAAKGFAITDSLPGNGLNWSIDSQSGPVTCGINGAVGSQTLNCPTPNGTSTLAAGATVTVTVKAKTTPAQCPSVSNTASVSVSNAQQATPNASDSVTVNCPNLVITKAADPGTISAADQAKFVITVDNVGLGVAKDVVVTDTLPAGFTWTATPGTPTCTISGAGVLTCNLGSIAPADPLISITLTSPTTAQNCAVHPNTATVAASNEPTGAAADRNSSNADLSVNCADIKIVKSPDAPSVNATDPIGFTITATNNGAGTAAGVTVTDTLPTNAGLAWSIESGDATCSISGGNQLNCTWGSIAPGNSKKVHLTSPTTIATCGDVNNTAGVTTTNDGSGNSSTKVVVNCPNVSVVKSKADGQADPVSAGDPISFKIVVTVGGTGTAYGVSLNDVLPANTSGWTITTNPGDKCQVLLGVLTCSFGNVTAPATFTVVVTGNAVGTNGSVTCGPLTNTATVSAGNIAADADNSSTAIIGVDCPSIVVEKTPAAGSINAGDRAEFTITVRNTGAGEAKGIIVSDELPQPANLTWAVDPAVTGCTIVNDILGCNFASIPAGEQVRIKVSATTTPLVCGVLTNYAYASATNDNVAGTTQSNLAQITVNCPDVVVQKVGNGTVSAGQVASFTITVGNASANGTGIARDVTLSDDLPDGIAWSDDSDSCSIDSNGILTCDFDDLDPGESHSVIVSGKTSPAECGIVTNTATIAAANEAASATENNSSTGTVTVNCPDIKVDKEPDAGDAGSTVSAGDDVVFTMTVTNLGPGVATDVELNDVLPTTATNWTEDSANCGIFGEEFGCDWDSLQPGESKSVTITGKSSSAQCVEVVNTVSVTAGNEAESDTAEVLQNNADSGSITVLCPDIEVEKSASNSPIGPGDNAVFTITVTNIGQGTAYGVSVSDTLPAGITWSENSDDCTIAGGVLDCSIESLKGPDGSFTVTLTGPTTTKQCGLIENTALASAENDPGEADQDSAEILVRCGSIQVVKVDQVAAGNPARPADGDWDFTITGPNGFNETRSIVGSGTATIENVPLGAGYAVSEVERVRSACPVPNETGAYHTTATPGTSQNLVNDGDVITFTFTNTECDIVLSTGMLIVRKVSDINGNHTQDAGENMLSGWPMTITGPQFPGGITINTNADGLVLLPGILAGNYTVTEGSQAGYQAVGVVRDDEGETFSVATTTSVNLGYEDTDTVTFYNQPRGGFLVRKHTLNRHNGLLSVVADDDDGWKITVTSAACGIDTSAITGADGTASFSNLPLCSDYTIAEDLGAPGASGYTPESPASLSNLTPGHGVPVQVSFTNVRITNTPPCENCNSVPTPTVPPPTSTPVIPTPTNTPVPPTATPATSSATPVSTTAGERTPGPGGPTPIAPSTGGGFGAGHVGGANLMLILAGLGAVVGGLVFLTAGRRRTDRS